MTKKELVGRLRLREDLTWGQATRIVNELFDDISNDVALGNEVYIPKFGSFKSGKVASKYCKHPVTGEMIKLPERQIVRFRMSEGFRRKLKG